MSNLFENKVRNDASPSKHNESTFSFLDRSGDKRFLEVRRILNKWFKKYPENEQEELRKRFQEDFDPSFYELFLHELFLNQGFRLMVHPKMTDSLRTPDFFIWKDELEFYLEAKVANDKSHKQKAIENRTNTLYDLLNKIDSPNFFLRIIELNFKTEKQPGAKKVIDFFERELKKYDPDDYEYLVKEIEGFDSLPILQHEDKDFAITVSIIPKPKKGRGNLKLRTIGIYPFQFTIGGSEESIKSSLSKKATRYGKMDKPYIICVNSFSDKRTDEFDVFNALFGSLRSVTYVNRNNPKDKFHKEERAKDGFFYGENGAKNTRVTGVLVTSIDIVNITNATHWLVKHPFAQKQLDFDKFDLTYLEVIDNNIQIIKKKSIDEVLSFTENQT
jgi:hypothetical protein